MVDEEIDRGVGRFDVDAAELALPERPDFFQRLAGAAGAGLVAQPAAGFVLAARGAEAEDDLDLLARRDLEPGLDRGAGIEAGADAVGEVLAPQGGGRGERAVAADEFGAVGGQAAVFAAAMEEREPVGEIEAERVLREEGAALRVEAGDDVHGAGVALLAEHPFAVARHGHAPRLVGAVVQRDRRELERGADGHVDGGLGE